MIWTMVDGLIVLGYISLILWVGLKDRRLAQGRGKKETLSEFSLADRQMPLWAVIASIIAAETSAGTFLGTPGESFASRNFTYLQLAFGLVLGRIIIAFLFLKPFYKAGVYSIYEYLEIRFGPRTRKLSSGLFLFTRTLASGTRLYIGAILLAVGFRALRGGHGSAEEEWALYAVAISVMTVLTAIYTTLGGIRAVIWTDTIQASLMVFSSVATFFFLLSKIPGGWAGAGEVLGGWDKVPFLDFGPSDWREFLLSKYTVGAAIFGSTFTTLATHGTDQDMVQRMLTAKDVQRSRWSLIVSGIADIPIVFVFSALGILLWVFYQKFPDPSLPVKSNEVFSHFILFGLPPVLRGLVIAGVLATAMGSLSAALNALATSYVRDFHSDTTSVRAARVATLAISGILLVVAIITAGFVVWIPDSRIIPIAIGVFGYTYGGVLGVFLLAMLTRNRGSDRWNGLAVSVSIITVFLLTGPPGIPLPSWVPVLAFPWRILAGTAVTFIGGFCFRTRPGSKSH
ncbi:MAG: sodium:solute symporter [Bdellovibrionales bacterium]|nr:sodium:solute symporter [Bdellovibrionales bacterium]